MKDTIIYIMEQHPAMILLIIVTILLMVSMTIYEGMRNRNVARRTEYVKALQELMKTTSGGKKK